MALATARRNPQLDIIGKGQQPDFVPFLRRHIGQQQHRVDRIIEFGHITHGAAHHPPHIQQHHDLLAAFCLVFNTDRFTTPCGGLPIDAPVFIIRLVIAQTFKFSPGPQDVDITYAQLPQAITAQE